MSERPPNIAGSETTNLLDERILDLRTWTRKGEGQLHAGIATRESGVVAVRPVEIAPGQAGGGRRPEYGRANHPKTPIMRRFSG
jgi:hypothetical protein